MLTFPKCVFILAGCSSLYLRIPLPLLILFDVTQPWRLWGWAQRAPGSCGPYHLFQVWELLACLRDGDSCRGHCPAFWLSTHTPGFSRWVSTSVLNAAGGRGGGGASSLKSSPSECPRAFFIDVIFALCLTGIPQNV